MSTELEQRAEAVMRAWTGFELADLPDDFTIGKPHYMWMCEQMVSRQHEIDALRAELYSTRDALRVAYKALRRVFLTLEREREHGVPAFVPQDWSTH